MDANASIAVDARTPPRQPVLAERVEDVSGVLADRGGR
jgi:hypothetical protein